ncbi:aminodeoxychorismate synthase component I [Sphingomonas sp. AX6]|uniref:aminodeoxychorismate synthase component I n=1 Tax=Sphingomonas sp. AX6 TaxID=2653171 RepID=UPI0013586F05|nr:aminodeoxychorismate synthase component I [Sphingomonas sp. AX6]
MGPISADSPFVLLDDARSGGGPARLYRHPVDHLQAHRTEEVPPLMARLREASKDGLHAAGWLSYGAGPAFEPKGGPVAPGTLPVAWFGLFEGYHEIANADLVTLLPDAAGAWVGEPQPLVTRDAYFAAAAQVADYISAGDIYQANLTFQARVASEGDPLALYAAIRRRAQAPFGALVRTEDAWLLSFSPELFFALEGGNLRARPMKGTARRGASLDADRAAIDLLRSDPKQRAENLMIVDLLRNDLSRIAMPGSMQVPERFVVETYPSVHQMVSGVTATLAPARDAVDAIEALFPCGSITGAPKVRAMQVIETVERGVPRGPYTGAIGRIDPTGDAMFNVAIRTLWAADGEPFQMGLGSGIVADSRANEEWAECLAKGAFVTAGQRGFDLIETMAFDPLSGVVLLERHLERMRASAATFGFAFDRHAARNALQVATFRLLAPSRVRLLLAKSGAIAIEIAAMPPAPDGPVEVAIAPLPVSPHDFRLNHKTTDRTFYDTARHASGAFDVLFATPEGRLTEGSFTNLFVEKRGVLVTPPAHGLLPGVLRAELIATGRAIEGELTAADLTQEFYIGNALRGLMIARLVAPQHAPR